MKSINQNITLENGISFTIKREDLLHPFVSGNKFRKLKYNILKAKAMGCNKLITFGGAYSNHIAATAFACQEAGIKSIGIIRGDELREKKSQNPTLTFAQDCGMQFEFVSRAAYQEKTDHDFIQSLSNKYGKFYLLPEGGTNDLAIKGCEEILIEEDFEFDYVCCSVGTGGTISGIINSSQSHQKILGFPALKGDFLREDIRKFVNKNNWDLILDYHFDGYAKVNNELIDFVNLFYQETKIKLDPVYTAKMVFGVIDLVKKGFFSPNAKILLIHTGGLQGIQGMNKMLETKKKSKIIFDE